MPDATLILPGLLLPSPDAKPLAGTGIAVEGDTVAAIDDFGSLRQRWPDANVIELPGCLAMAGLVNAHQHGRGLSQIQLGYPDHFLEIWIHNRRGRGVLDPYPITRLAAAKMAANGVTATVHANYSYGSGDYESEVRACLRAYDEVGIRVTMCIGAMDRGVVAYPPEDACFMRGLPDHLRLWLEGPRPPSYARDGAATVALMQRLRADYAGHPRIRFCYGPAGPQWVTDDLLGLMVRDADRHGLGLHMHLLESPAQAAAAKTLYPEGVLERMEKIGALTPRTVLAHGVWVDDGGMEIIARHNCVVVRNAGCNLRLRNGIAPVARYLSHGVRLAIGTDNNALADDEDVLKELRLTGILARIPEWHGAEPPTAVDLLSMATVNGAAAAQLDPRAGILEPGAKADLIAISMERSVRPYLDSDMPLLEAMLARSEGADVRLTMVDGRIVFRDGALSFVDMDLAAENAARAALAARLPGDPKNRERAQELAPLLVEHYRSIELGSRSR